MEKCGCGGGRSRSSLALLTIGFCAILAHWEHPKVCHCGYGPAADGQIKRTMSAVDFGIKRGHNHDQVDERKTKERRKKDEKKT